MRRPVPRGPQAATKSWPTKSKSDARTSASGLGRQRASCCWPIVIGLGWYLRSPQFADLVRRKLIATIEDATGGRVELAAFHWNLSQLAFEADGLTIHGLEAPGQLPYVHVDHALVRMHIISFLQRQISLEQMRAAASGHPRHRPAGRQHQCSRAEDQVAATLAGAAVVRPGDHPRRSSRRHAPAQRTQNCRSTSPPTTLSRP